MLQALEKIPGWGILIWLWNNKTLVAIVGAAGVFLYYVWLADKRGQERDELKEQLRGASQVISDQRAWHDDTVAALERKANNETERSDFERGAVARNQADRVAGDGPVAPVLRDGLSALRRRQAEGRIHNP
jgi:type II secretory pathway pseudopilin PulG